MERVSVGVRVGGWLVVDLVHVGELGLIEFDLRAGVPIQFALLINMILAPFHDDVHHTVEARCLAVQDTEYHILKLLHRVA